MRGLAVLLLALLLHPAAAETLAPEKLTLGVTAVAEFTPVFVAVERGLFAAHGLDVTLQIVPNSSTLIPAMLSGAVQIGGPPAPVFLPAAGQGLPIVCLAAAALTDPAQPVGAVVARPDSTIATARDLEGTRLAVSGINSIMQILLRDWMVRKGADPARVRFVEIPFSHMQDVLKSGAVDGVVVVEPFVSRMVQAGAARIVADYYREVPQGTLSATYCTTRDWAAQHQAAIAGFRAGLRDAADLIARDPAAARAVLASTLKLPPNVAAALPFGVYRFALAPGQIAWWLRVLREQGVMDADIDPAAVLVP